MVFDSNQKKEFPSLKFALNLMRWFSLIAGGAVLILHHFGHVTVCSGQNRQTVSSWISLQCTEHEYRIDRFYFLIQAIFICASQYAWFLTCRKLSNVETLMIVFREMALQRSHDFDAMKERIRDQNGWLRHVVYDSFVKMIYKIPDDTLLKNIIRLSHVDRFICYIYFVKCILQWLTVAAFGVITSIKINKTNLQFVCAVDSSATCIAPYGYITYVALIFNVTILLYAFFVLSGFLVWTVRELMRSSEDFNNLFFTLDLWLANVNLKQNVGVLAVREIYGQKSPPSIVLERLI